MTFQDRIVEAFRVIEEDLVQEKTMVLEKASRLKNYKGHQIPLEQKQKQKRKARKAENRNMTK